MFRAQKRSEKVLEWSNHLICGLLFAKFLKSYYNAVGEFDEEHLKTSLLKLIFLGGPYMVELLEKKHFVLEHKIHIISHRFFGTHSPEETLRHNMQQRLLASYRALQAGDAAEVIHFAGFVRKLNMHAKTPEEKNQSALAVLSFLYDYAVHKKYGTKDVSEDMLHQLFAPKNVPSPCLQRKLWGVVWAPCSFPLPFGILLFY